MRFELGTVLTAENSMLKCKCSQCDFETHPCPRFVLFAGYLFSRCFVVSLPVTSETQESYGSCLLAVRLIKGGFVVAAVLLVLRRGQKLLLWQQLLDLPKWVRLSSTQKFIFNVPCGTDALDHE